MVSCPSSHHEHPLLDELDLGDELLLLHLELLEGGGRGRRGDLPLRRSHGAPCRRLLSHLVVVNSKEIQQILQGFCSCVGHLGSTKTVDIHLNVVPASCGFAGGG